MKLSWLSSRVYKISFLFVFCLILTLPNPVFAIIVMAEGSHPLSGKNIASAREVALSNALKTAVKSTARGINPTLDDRSLEKLILENPIGYIRSYRILDENLVGEEYKINIEADVDSERLKNKLKGFTENTVKPVGKPSISIVVLRTPESDPVIKTLPLDDVKIEISSVLIRSGYKVVEPLGDIRLETYVTLKTTESKVEKHTYSVLGSVFIRAKDKNGKILSEINDTSYESGSELSQLSLQAIKQAGANATVKLSGEFDKKWNVSQRNKGRTIEITFLGLNDYKQYEELDDILAKSIGGIDHVTKRVFRNGVISFLVISSVSQDELAKTIENQKTPGFSLRLNNTSPDRIEFNVITRWE